MWRWNTTPNILLHSLLELFRFLISLLVGGNISDLRCFVMSQVKLFLYRWGILSDGFSSLIGCFGISDSYKARRFIYFWIFWVQFVNTSWFIGVLYVLNLLSFSCFTEWITSHDEFTVSLVPELMHFEDWIDLIPEHSEVVSVSIGNRELTLHLLCHQNIFEAKSRW